MGSEWANPPTTEVAGILAMIDDAPEKHKSKGWTNAMPKNKRS